MPLPAFLAKPLNDPDVFDDITAVLDSRERKRQEASASTSGFYSAAASAQHRKCNRYRDIKAYDRTRLKMVGDSDFYVNGNAVKVLGRTWFACQGPTPAEISSFWRLFLEPVEGEQHVPSVIVQLTRLVEGKFVKAHPYFWGERDRPLEIGEGASVTLIDQELLGSFRISKLSVRRQDQPPKTVTHFGFRDWSDHSSPANSDSFLSFYQHLEPYIADASVPIVVHCSAGVGRTGSFITYHTGVQIIEKLKKGGSTLASITHQLNETINRCHGALPPYTYKVDRSSPDVIGLIIDTLREQRNMMVQSHAQALWCYQMLARLWR